MGWNDVCTELDRLPAHRYCLSRLSRIQTRRAAPGRASREGIVNPGRRSAGQRAERMAHAPNVLERLESTATLAEGADHAATRGEAQPHRAAASTACASGTLPPPSACRVSDRAIVALAVREVGGRGPAARQTGSRTACVAGSGNCASATRRGPTGLTEDGKPVSLRRAAAFLGVSASALWRALKKVPR